MGSDLLSYMNHCISYMKTPHFIYEKDLNGVACIGPALPCPPFAECPATVQHDLGHVLRSPDCTPQVVIPHTFPCLPPLAPESTPTSPLPTPPAPIYVAGIHILDLCNRPRGYQFRKASSPFRTTRPNKRNTQSPFCLHNGCRYKRLFPALRHGNETPSKELHGTSRRNFLKKPLPAAGSRRNFFGNL